VAVDMVCERKDGLCNLCGADPHEDCPLTDLAPELAEWSERKAADKELDAQIKCPIGSCQRHQRCMYQPCRATKAVMSDFECSEGYVEHAFDDRGLCRRCDAEAAPVVDNTDDCESCQ
jgi:hypothetical protein